MILNSYVGLEEIANIKCCFGAILFLTLHNSSKVSCKENSQQRTKNWAINYTHKALLFPALGEHNAACEKLLVIFQVHLSTAFCCVIGSCGITNISTFHVTVPFWAQLTTYILLLKVYTTFQPKKVHKAIYREKQVTKWYPVWKELNLKSCRRKISKQLLKKDSVLR